MEFPKLNILMAYPYIGKNTPGIISGVQNNINFLLDSGAFTAWKQNQVIDIDKYLGFIESFPIIPWAYIALDVIGEKEKTKKNYEYMMGKGFNPVPVFTRGEDFSVIEDLYKTSDFIAIGGLVKTKRNAGFVKSVMDQIGKRKVHLLGYCKHNMILHYRPTSCDSSSFAMSEMFGILALYDNGKFTRHSKSDFQGKPDYKLLNFMKSRYQVDPSELAINNNWMNSRHQKRLSIRITTRSFIRYANDLFNNTGVRYFFATSNDEQLKLLIECYYQEKELAS